MRSLAILALTVVLIGALAVGCGGDGASPSPTPVATTSPAPTPAATATPVSTPTPTPSAVAEAWVARYKGPSGGAEWVYDIAVDGSGNVYVTGKSFNDTPYDYSYVTVKYDNDGNELWVARYDGPGGDDDVAQAIAVDGYGNVYVTGKSYNSLHEDYAYATIKYDGDGSELWVARYDGAGVEDDDGRAIAIDGSGNVYVTGSSGGDYATIEYDSNGNQLWAARYEGSPGSDDGAVGIALDGSGNAYVAGTSQGDYAALKYDSNGNQIWVARYDNSGGDDTAKAMALDGAGNVYVTGRSYSSSSYQYEYATVKFDSEGNQPWAAGCQGLECGAGEPVAVAVDGSGNVYVTGRCYDHRTLLYGYATVKYDSEGEQQWIARYDGAAGGRESWPFDMALDGSGNIYVTGDSYNGSGVNYSYVTLKYDSEGSEIWAACYDGPADGWDQAVALAVDGSGNVYVTGKSDGGTSCRDFLTIKYVSGDSEL